MDPNRGAYAAAVERLDALASGERALPMAGVGDELLAVAGMLEGQPALRRALTDPSRTGQARAGLLDSLLDGRAGDDTRTILQILVAGRWSSGADLLNAVERLGVEALLASADNAGELVEVEDELFRFGQVVDGDLELRTALGASTAPVPLRSQLAHRLLEGKAHSITVRLVDVALHGLGGRRFSAALSRLIEFAADRRERELAYVTVASSLTEDEQRRLAAKLSEMYGRRVELKVSVAPRILGGIRVRIGSDLFDATVLRRLTDARTQVVGRP